jgi:Hfq protein
MPQEQFLHSLAEGRVPVAIYLVNGIRLLGVVDFRAGWRLRGRRLKRVPAAQFRSLSPARHFSSTVSRGLR